jgi:hypothetical protein
MAKLKNLIILSFILFLSSCIKPETVKTITWNGYRITLSVINGGATVAYLYKIEYKRKRFLGRDRLIFSSYATPSVNNISIENNRLIIHCFSGENQTNDVPNNLKDINSYLGNPVKYRRSVLESTNKAYIEPGFITQERQLSIKSGIID